MKKEPIQTPEAADIQAIIRPHVEAHSDAGIEAASLEGLPKVVQKLVASALPSYHDKWQLARSARRFYHLLNKDLLKEKVYSFGMVPIGLLDNAVFNRFQPNFHELINFFRRRRDLHSIIRLDDELVWPLLALMPEMEEALKEAVANDPKQVDFVGCDVLDYLAIRGNEKLFLWWIETYYPGFTKDDKPDLLWLAITGKNKAIVRLLIDVYKYPLDWTKENLDEPNSPLRVILAFGDIDLYNELWSTLDCVTTKTDIIHELCPAIEAAKAQNWALCDGLIGSANRIDNLLGFNAEQKAELLCYAARDDHQRFLLWLPLCHETDFRKFTINYDTILAFACQGGNIETFKFILEQGWFLPDDECSRLNLRPRDLAAQFRHPHIIDYIRVQYQIDVSHEDNRFDENIADCAAMSGDWEWFLEVLRNYFPREYRPRKDSEGPISPLTWAIREGHLYFTQQFILKYGSEYFHDNEASLLRDAKDAKNPALARWLEKQFMTFQSQKDNCISDEDDQHNHSHVM